MSQQTDCCSSTRNSIVMSCSGGSNVGQITNEVAKRLSLAGNAKFFCLVGIGGKVSGMIASVNGAETTLVLDGCSVACAKNAWRMQVLKTMIIWWLRNWVSRKTA